jgi:hypothetical protein
MDDGRGRMTGSVGDAQASTMRGSWTLSPDDEAVDVEL